MSRDNIENHFRMDELFSVHKSPLPDFAVNMLADLIRDIKEEQESLGTDTPQGKNLRPQLRKAKALQEKFQILKKRQQFEKVTHLSKDLVRREFRDFLEKYISKAGHDEFYEKIESKLQELWNEVVEK